MNLLKSGQPLYEAEETLTRAATSWWHQTHGHGKDMS